MPKTAAERKAEQRARVKALGLCTMCCTRRARVGKATCKLCYENRKKRLYRDRELAKLQN